MPDQTLTRAQLAEILQRYADQGASEDDVRAQAQQLASRVVDDAPKTFEQRTQERLAATEAQSKSQWDNATKMSRDPSSVASMAATAVLPERKLIQGGLQLMAGTGAGLYKGEGFGEALGHGAEAAGIPLAMEGIQQAANYVGPKLKQAGFDTVKSVWKVRDSAAKLAKSSQGGHDLDAGANEIIQHVVDAGRGAPSQATRQWALGQKKATGEAVEDAWQTAPPRPVGITREDRLLPSHATSVEETTLHMPDQAPFQGATPAAMRPNPHAAPYPYNLAPENPAGRMQPPQYMGEPARPGLRTRLPDTPGVLQREVPPRVVPGQPFDTVARKDVLQSIDADIAAAQASASPTTGLESLRARWAQMPEYIDRATAREVVKGINTRLAPRYHNALNDPVAVAAEKEVGRTVKDAMMTDQMREANAAYGAAKPVALAASHAAKRAGSRELLSLPAIAKMLVGGSGGFGIAGPVGGVAGAVGGALASHPVPQGWIGQKMYDAGKALPAAVKSQLDADHLRAAIMSLLAQQENK